VRVLPPPGSSFALKDQGADTADSDINRIGSSIGFTDIITLASNVISITRIDAGLLNVQPSPTPTNTATPTATSDATATPTSTVEGVVAPEGRVFLPLLEK
jgi:hypothetical protein